MKTALVIILCMLLVLSFVIIAITGSTENPERSFAEEVKIQESLIDPQAQQEFLNELKQRKGIE